MNAEASKVLREMPFPSWHSLGDDNAEFTVWQADRIRRIIFSNRDHRNFDKIVPQRFVDVNNALNPEPLSVLLSMSDADFHRAFGNMPPIDRSLPPDLFEYAHGIHKLYRKVCKLRQKDRERGISVEDRLQMAVGSNCEWVMPDGSLVSQAAKSEYEHILITKMERALDWDFKDPKFIDPNADPPGIFRYVRNVEDEAAEAQTEREATTHCERPRTDYKLFKEALNRLVKEGTKSSNAEKVCKTEKNRNKRERKKRQALEAKRAADSQGLSLAVKRWQSAIGRVIKQNRFHKAETKKHKEESENRRRIRETCKEVKAQQAKQWAPSPAVGIAPAVGKCATEKPGASQLAAEHGKKLASLDERKKRLAAEREEQRQKMAEEAKVVEERMRLLDVGFAINKGK